VRVGLVLGAGGVAGGAFHAGTLAAIEEATGWDPRTAVVVVGTSAGSVSGVGLRAGLSAADAYARAAGRPMSTAGNRLMRTLGAAPRPPRLRVGRTPPRAADVGSLLRRAAARPLTTRPAALVSALLPEGATATTMISEGVGMVLRDWPDEPLWICAVRRSDARRVVFGRDARPDLGSAVAASCAIPGAFTPVDIDGDTYVDGGAHSPTNADVLADRALDLDVVVVSSPMSITGRGLRLRLDEPMRRWSRALLDGEALRLRRRGIKVLAFQPTPSVLQVTGVNAMDPSRRAVIADAAHAAALTRLARADASALFT
jgi:NTE family protein